MSKKYQLTERDTNEKIYPITTDDAIIGLKEKYYDKSTIDDELSTTPIAGHVIDEDTFPAISVLTREDLKKDLLIDMWNKMCAENVPSAGNFNQGNGGYNTTTGFFECNGLTDVTSNEAIPILLDRITNPNEYAYRYQNNKKLRANICNYTTGYYEVLDIRGIACKSSLEILRLTTNVAQAFSTLNIDYMLNGSSVRKVIGVMSLSKITSDGSAFVNASNLEDISLIEVKCDLRFGQSPKLSYSSLEIIVRRAANGSTPITITVHPDVYKALTGEASEYPFNGGTQEQWQQLMLDAINKNIIFASA